MWIIFAGTVISAKPRPCRETNGNFIGLRGYVNTIIWHVKRSVAHDGTESTPGRPPLLAAPFRDQAIEHVRSCYAQRKPCTMPQILDFIMEISGISLDRDSVRMMLKRDG
jgi:hypothetical protein